MDLRKIGGGLFYRSIETPHGTYNPESYELLSVETFACPQCGAPDKARLFALFFRQEGFSRLEASPGPMLHFDPEAGMPTFFGSRVRDYRMSSFPNGPGPLHFDIRNLSRVEGQLHCFVASHILEHVREDSVAAKELFSSLAPGGFGIVQVPIMLGLPETWEDASHVTEEERLRHYGQTDHLRVYARADFVSLLVRAGFHVRQLDSTFFGEHALDKIGVSKTAVLYVVDKPLNDLRV